MTLLSQHTKGGGKSSAPKAVVLREELVALTKEPLSAIVLGQLLYWTQRVKDFDLHLQEEQVFNPECHASPRHGWLYKTANDLIIETMICVDRTTMRRYLKSLMDQGWLEERTHPKNRWDKTSQYRLNLRKLQEDLFLLGFDLPGIEILFQKELTHKLDENDHEVSLTSDTAEAAEIPNGDFDPSREDFTPSSGQNAPSNVTNPPLNIQRLQTKNINRDQQQRPRARENFSHLEKMLVGETIAEEMIRLWDLHVSQSYPPSKEPDDLHFSDDQKDQLESLFAFHFRNDMRLWEQFCIRTKSTSFMMGGGVRKWFVGLKWLLREDNLLKALEGKYESSNKPVQQNSFEHKLDQIQANPVNDEEKATIIHSIKDPVWKKWCSRLAQGVRLNDFKMLNEPLSVLQLQEIANARFIECEDERLVWIGSTDQRVLNAIENLRLKINWVFEKEYPKATSLRTRLEPQNVPFRGPSSAQEQSLIRSELE